MARIEPTTYPLAPAQAGAGPAHGATLTIRTAMPDDAAPTVAFLHAMFATSRYTLTSPGEFAYSTDQEREHIEKHLGHPRQLMLLAIDDASRGIIGVLVLTQNTAKRKLRHSVELGMSVHEAFRGRRVGTAMLDAAVRWARDNPDLRQITLAVYEANAPARRLYERSGFVTHGTLPGGLIHDDGSRWDQLFMHLEV